MATADVTVRVELDRWPLFVALAEVAEAGRAVVEAHDSIGPDEWGAGAAMVHDPIQALRAALDDAAELLPEPLPIDAVVELETDAD